MGKGFITRRGGSADKTNGSINSGSCPDVWGKPDTLSVPGVRGSRCFALTSTGLSGFGEGSSRMVVCFTQMDEYSTITVAYYNEETKAVSFGTYSPRTDVYDKQSNTITLPKVSPLDEEAIFFHGSYDYIAYDDGGI